EAISALGIPPDEVAGDIVDAMRANRFWIFTHDMTKKSIAVRYADIEAGRNPTNPYAEIASVTGLEQLGRPGAGGGAGEGGGGRRS
ncbi:hypothetical protein K2X89_17895, partial [Myxococcota bacterium]|nr:hypothetical protein [Myxococcota bacterium]